MDQNPYEVFGNADKPRWEFSPKQQLITQIVAAPFLGAVTGAVASALSGILCFAITDFDWSAEASIGMLYLTVLHAIYGIEPGFLAGLVVIPGLFFCRRNKFLDAALCAIALGIAAYLYYDARERGPHRAPHLLYMVPRVASSAIAAGATIWLLGRGTRSTMPKT